MALPDQAIDLFKVVAREAQAVQVHVDQRLSAVEQTQHDSLTERRRDRRDADIDIAPGHPHPDTAVLR